MAATRCAVAVATLAEADPIAGCLMRPGGGMDGGDRLRLGAMGNRARAETRASKATQSKCQEEDFFLFFENFSVSFLRDERRGSVPGYSFPFPRERKRAGFYSLFFLRKTVFHI